MPAMYGASLSLSHETYIHASELFGSCIVPVVLCLKSRCVEADNADVEEMPFPQLAGFTDDDDDEDDDDDDDDETIIL
jgi:hypothetical protein